jgi:hypothetical protein
VAKIAFTGTSVGLTGDQRWTLENFFRATPGANELHHGVCEGADHAAHLLAQRFGWRTVGYPGVNKRGEAAGRAHGLVLDEVHPERPYLKRNRDIVAGASLLVATPRGPERMRGSGTWATVRYARQAGVPVLIIWPDGTVTEEA